MRAVLSQLLDAGADLLLGSACVACARPGRPLCLGCREVLPAAGFAVRPDPAPPGLVTTYAVGAYDGALRALVLGHKEDALHALAAPLGRGLAAAVVATLPAGGAAPRTPVVLVPVPSRRSATRSRGHDPTLTVTRRAARDLTRSGRPTRVARLLRLRPGVADQAGLTAGQRRANLAHSMASRGRALARLCRRTPHAHVVICDDVLTTGATAREAQRALEAVGVPVRAVAVVAATQRRAGGGRFRAGN